MYHTKFLFNVIPINYNIGPISHEADHLSLINLAWFQVWIKTVRCKCGETIDCQSQNNANNQDRMMFNIVDNIIVKSN